MKKILLLMVVSILLVACGSKKEIKVEEQPKANEMSTFSVKITEGSKAVEDFKGTATFQMKGMDHGTIEAKLNHQQDGIYEDKVKLPMSGKWTAKIEGDGLEKTIELDIK
ncbi:FixH family protein [Macrococcus sp. EM39E]|uniref:FixH family protein n=1 Tax=Macrococcus animalis TaxID=3395467 RepID=UPI0039BF7E58